MKAHLEWIVCVIRTGKNFEGHGDPYEFVVTGVRDGDKMYLKGAVGKYDKATYKAITSAIKETGVTKIEWERRNNKARVIIKEI